MPRAAGNAETSRQPRRERRPQIGMRNQQGGSSPMTHYAEHSLAGAAAARCGTAARQHRLRRRRLPRPHEGRHRPRSVGPQTTWDGPTTGPKAAKDKSVVYVSLTQNSSGNADSAKRRRGSGQGARLEVHADRRQGHRDRRRRRAGAGDRAQAGRHHPRLGRRSRTTRR